MDKKKDYTIWHEQKTIINNGKQRPEFREAEVWFCNLGNNIGFEQDGMGMNYLRPVVVVKKFNKESCIVVPLTKTKKSGRFYFCFSYKDNVSSYATLTQIKLIDSKRLNYHSGFMSRLDFLNLKEKLRELLL